VREISSNRLACAGAQKRQDGRKKSQEVYITRMCGATPSGRIPTKLGKCVRLTDVIKRAKFYRYEVSELCGFEVSMLPYGTLGVLNTYKVKVPIFSIATLT